MPTVPSSVPITPASGGQLVPLVAWVRADEALRVQKVIYQLLTEVRSDTRDEYKPSFPNTHGPKDAWDLPQWTADDASAAAWILNVLGPRQKRVVAKLVAAGADGVWTSDLRRFAGYDDATSMSGVFKAIGGRFRATDRRPVWNGGRKEPQKGQLLSVADETARLLFAHVLNSEHPDLIRECQTR